MVKCDEGYEKGEDGYCYAKLVECDGQYCVMECNGKECFELAEPSKCEAENILCKCSEHLACRDSKICSESNGSTECYYLE